MVERHSWAVQQVAGVGQQTVEDGRITVAALATPSGRITSRTGLFPAAAAPAAVTATTPTANGFVHVAPFRGVVQSQRGGGAYLMCLDAIKDINVLGTAPADASNPRNDLIVAQQSDAYFADADSEFRVRHVVGTPAATPVDPPVTGSADYITLARIVVPANATTITTSNITSFDVARTVAAGGILPVTDATARSGVASPYAGQAVYRLDTKRVEVHDGTDWRVPSIPVVAATSEISNPITGQLIMLSPTNIVQRWTGSTWVDAFPIGGTTNATRHEARYYRTTTQSIPNNIDQRVHLPDADYLSDDVSSTAVGNGTEFTLNRTGLWQLSANIRFVSTGSAAERAVAIAGSPTASRYAQAASDQTGEPCSLSCTTTRRFNAGDKVSMWAYQNTGAAVNLDQLGNGVNMSLTWLRG
ncbi:hypothetical protein SAMN05216215_11206 [Saccharopolyspora shandongensis]|uniref:Minor tail protein n=1 Tax=Saccharopolyspora shandongensis TaxID=418495 RepID=A0A1H3UAJ3_9PSEU|nr:hypothetical protein [Saccharopolyspora shandongensis]SDZ59111.1 hypothetical protein SAMN05216215_11206 [Saccharopolyspora shandongensis]